MLSTPNIARGSSGSVTRTISRNIRLMSANDVTTTTTSRRSSRIGSSGFGMPAMNEPTTIRNMPGDDRLDRARDVEAGDQLQLA